ncbi:MAG: hypothetical protein JWR18_521 [Segetibacter sp.]|jgi:hypothetical protein|nr:hypothetical protein [Segetibacter sp.]
MVVSEIKLYELLKAKIGESEAEAFIQILENKVETRLNEKTSVFATKEDLAKTEGKLLSTISEAKVDIIKWMVATATAIVGTVALMKLS